MEITFINHATCLIHIDKTNILTDPIWSNWIGLPIFGVKRMKEPGLPIEKLPKIDIVLISHNHFDHMDIPTLKILQKHHQPLFVTGLGNREILNKNDINNVLEFDWWRRTIVNDIMINFVPAQHWSGRMPWDIDRSIWGGFIIGTLEENVYFAGDTAYGNFLYTIHRMYPKIDVSLLPIAPYMEHMRVQHMTPEDAVRAHITLNSNLSIGIHSGTFYDHESETLRRINEALKTNNINKDEFIILEHGETKHI